MKLTNTIAVRPTKTVYRDGSYAIKVMNEEFSASDVLNEALNLSIVFETGFPVPMLHEVLKIDGKWAIVTDYIEGKTLADLIKDNPADTDKYCERMVDIQLKMHTYTSERLRHLTDKMHVKISKSSLDTVVRYELHMRLNGLPKHNMLCHGDFIPSNIIITPSDEVYVIDWSHATQGSASAEAAQTYLRFKLAGEDKFAEKYLELFCLKSDSAMAYVQKWMSIVAASQLVKNVKEERELLLNWANVIEYV